MAEITECDDHDRAEFWQDSPLRAIIEGPQNEAGPAGNRSLTRSSDYGREGLAMKATRIDFSGPYCVPFDGREHKYQAEAAQAFYVEFGTQPATWEWITTTCRTSMCLNVEHMKFAAPRKLGYLPNQCVYCGRSAYTEDHLLPKNFTGKAKRSFVVTVPACGTCNSALSDTLTWSITERRAICHARLRRRFRKVLAFVEYGPTDLAELGPTLRSEVEAGIESKRSVMEMLAWPGDMFYDVRACEKAGIENGYQIGLLIDQAEADRIASEVTAPARRETLADVKRAERMDNQKARERKRRMDEKISALSAQMRAKGAE